jgi:hypothetical protein
LRDFLRDIAKSISRDAPTLGRGLKLILSGSCTTFYSENPSKAGKFFDKEARQGPKAGDIDVAIVCRDPQKLEQHFGGPPTNRFGTWGSNSTMKAFPSLRDIYKTWGNHPFLKLYVDNPKYFNRDIGIVTLSFDWHKASTYSRWWKRSYMFDPSIDDIKVPRTSLVGGGMLCPYGSACTRRDCFCEHPKRARVG